MIDALVRLGEEVMPESVVLDRSVGDGWQRLRLRATASLTGIATGSFARPSAHVPFQVAGEADFLGFAYTQFALPVVAGPRLDLDFDPAPNLHSPPVVGMLLGRAGRRYVWVAPLDHPHEQVIAVADGSLRWGWHGDLDVIPSGFSTTGSLAVELAPRDWELWVCAPRGERADAGDLRKYVIVESDLT